MDYLNNRECDETFSGGEELLQSARVPLQLLVLMSLENHLQLVQLLHHLGFMT